MNKILTLTACLFLLGQTIMAQTRIKGKILDSQDNSELIGATVIVEGTTIGVATSLDGTFQLDVPAGKKTLKISFVGYVDKNIDIELAEGETKDLGTLLVDPNAVGLKEIMVVASFAQDRKTPVALSKIEPLQIEEKLSTQEFPELLKSTPSVYATKTGGGFGDGRINLRGFESNNIGVLINGVPVNDMENGKVYWSNWAGLSDVTRSIQVQRGLGASKLAISSVGGTINILTNSSDAQKGGSVYYGMGNNDFQKLRFSVSSGLLDNGWSMTLAGAKEMGSKYVIATNYEAYTYFVNISKKINKQHQLSFTAFGAPQWHNQRGSMHSIDFYREHPDYRRLNTDYGIRKGEIYNGGYSYNKYHKPQISLNHYWNINEKSILSTAVYASFSSGGGRRIQGEKDGWLEYPYPSGGITDEILLTSDGLLNWDAVIDSNANSMTGSKAVVTMAVNRHDWYGVLSTYNKEMNDFNLTVGVDGRYYKAYHYEEIVDLLGGSYFLDGSNINRDPSIPLKEGDKYSYNYHGEVFWEGLFGQLEYSKDILSAFVSASVSNTGYKRTDYFQYTPDNRESDPVSFLGYSGKLGGNVNLSETFNIFLNGGYFSRAPYFKYAFIGYTNTTNKEAENEKVASAELGLGFRNDFIRSNLSIYHTRWLDKALTVSTGVGETANLLGLNAIHQGVELETWIELDKKLDVKAMASVGDWKWQKDVTASLYNEEQEYVGETMVYAEDLHVGDAAQTTFALGMNYEFVKNFKIGADINHFNRLYASFDVNTRSNVAEKGIDAWELPSYEVVDMNFSYNFKIADLKATFYGNVNNLLDTEYISDAVDGSSHDAATSSVYYGFGRTWSTGIKIKF